LNPYTVDLLRRNNYPTANLRSKDWAEFARPDAPQLDFVFTVCDKAAGEICPIWPGQPMTAHWGFPDPAAFQGSEAETGVVFAEVFRQIYTRITLFIALPIAGLDRLSLQKRLDNLGRAPAPTT
jgi:protein-tyrosine-phosphatase